jgi:hypothetical protein
MRLRRGRAVLSGAILASLLGGGLLVVGAVPAFAGDCVPTDAWTETIPAQGEPAITVENPDYVPEIAEVTREVEHPAETKQVCHEAVTHQEFRYRILIPYWTVEHKEIQVPAGSDGAAVLQWLANIGATDKGGGWWHVPDSVIAAVNFNPVTVPDTGPVNLNVYGGPNITVQYRKTHDVLGTPPPYWGIQQSQMLYWNGSTWVVSQSAAAWVTVAPDHGEQFDQRTVTTQEAWCETVVVREAWTETVIDQEFVPAQGTPTIEVPNPDYVPARSIEHPAVVCTVTPPVVDDPVVDDPVVEDSAVLADPDATDPVAGPVADTGGEAAGCNAGPLMIGAAALMGAGLAAIAALGLTRKRQPASNDEQ